jgi:hypothetical protein
MKTLPIPTHSETRAILRRGKKKLGNKDCFANRAYEATKLIANYVELNFEQRRFFFSFISEVAAASYSAGYGSGLRAARLRKGGAS